MSFDLEQDLNQRREQNLYRRTRMAQSPQAPVMEIDGHTYLTFCSNDYLGLANHPMLVKAFKHAADEFGVGSGAAHLVNGHSYYHEKLEEALAEFTGRDAAILFSTGYMANLGVVTALLDKQDGVFEDKWNHASLLDAGLLSGARFQRYLHNDMGNLGSRLKRSEARRKLIVTDGVFSMDGDWAQLDGVTELAKQNDAWVMVDDAHGLGVLGESGAGLCEAQNQSQDDVQILMGTLGKGMGTAGAFVAGSKELIEYLTNFARPYIYTTAMPAAIAAATLESINIVKNEPERRVHLQMLIKHFRDGAKQLGLNLMTSHTAIQPVLVGDAQQALNMSEALRQQGIMVTPIRPPTVPVGTARLRVTLSASHSLEQVNQLLDALAALSANTESN
ncbi:8-amino-7-oxononanoate synthase [Oceaniserpentilla sp. 4NH20-0058]|uniref:8-amino-7-oxononanoate synthase n=1 Tax=Oceaniserpentilla sp. 4NH20-0058 TaxID=3127660 RepID=UPI0031080D33